MELHFLQLILISATIILCRLGDLNELLKGQKWGTWKQGGQHLQDSILEKLHANNFYSICSKREYDDKIRHLHYTTILV